MKTLFVEYFYRWSLHSNVWKKLPLHERISLKKPVIKLHMAKFNFASIVFMLFSLTSYCQDIVFETSSKYMTVENLQQELKKYPQGLMQEYSPIIVVVPNTGDNTRFCGCIGYSKIKINTNCEIYKRAFHHEMSSLLLRKYDIMKERGFMQSLADKFAKLNGSYTYHDIPVSNGYDNIDVTSNLGQNFYGRKYAMTMFENDFNVIAEYLFCSGAETINFMLNNPDKPAAKKIQLVIDFYHNLDSSFTVSFFKNQHI